MKDVHLSISSPCIAFRFIIIIIIIIRQVRCNGAVVVIHNHIFVFFKLGARGEVQGGRSILRSTGGTCNGGTCSRNGRRCQRHWRGCVRSCARCKYGPLRGVGGIGPRQRALVLVAVTDAAVGRDQKHTCNVFEKK